MRTERKNNNLNFWSCDFETTTPDSNYYKEHNDVCICLAGAINSLNKEFVYDTCFTNLLDKIINVDKDNVITLYFHNLGNFDGGYILDELVTKGWKFESKGDRGLNTFIADNGNIYSIRFKYKKRNIVIFDSLKLLTLSIEALGKTQGIEKLHSDYIYEPIPLEEFKPEDIEYLKRDCLIPIEPLLNIFRTFKNPKMTAGSTSVRGLEDYITDNNKSGKQARQLINWLTMCRFEQSLKMLPFCYGGLTFYNRLKRNKKIDGVYCYDANSFYPTQMVSKPMIIGSTCKEVDEDYEPLHNEVELLEILVMKAKLKGKKDFYFLRNYAVLNSRLRGEKTHPTVDRFVDKINQPTTMYIFKTEFEALQKWYDFEYFIKRKWVYETEWYMKDYIQWLYDERKRLKSMGDPSELTMKIILNSTFGKFMENPVKEQLIYLPAGQYNVGDKWGIYYLIRKKSEDFNYKGYEGFVAISKKEKPLVRNPIIGAYITACSRTELMNLVYKYRDHVVYGDTDSIFLTCKIPEFENSPNELGEWKNEYPDLKDGFSLYVFGRKRYVCFDEADEMLIKTSMCGASKKSINKYIKDNKLYSKDKLDGVIGKRLYNMKLSKKTINGKRYLVDAHYEIKETKE